MIDNHRVFMLRVLSLLESRVLGVLVEKERTVPDSYPLTLNALVAGCNQKSSRDPVLNASETDVQAGGDGLKSMLLVIERSGGRVARYAHNVERMMNVPQQAAALLAVLMLRGPGPGVGDRDRRPGTLLSGQGQNSCGRPIAIVVHSSVYTASLAA